MSGIEQSIIPPTDRRWSDGRRINALDPVDLVYWTKFFGVDELELLTAIDKVGTSVGIVKNYLDVQETLMWIANGGRTERRRISPV